MKLTRQTSTDIDPISGSLRAEHLTRSNAVVCSFEQDFLSSVSWGIVDPESARYLYHREGGPALIVAQLATFHFERGLCRNTSSPFNDYVQFLDVYVPREMRRDMS